MATNEDFAKRAVGLGQGVLSSCEHGHAGNYWECSELAAQYDLKWRYVAEAYMVRDRQMKDKTNAHMILAAKTRKGIGDLNEAISEANISGYYYRPRVDMDLLLGLDPRDVFLTTACVGGVFRYGYEEAERLILTLAKHYGDAMMLEVQYHDTAKQKEVNDFILSLRQRHGIPLIMGTDSHFIYPEDKALRDLRLEASHIHYDDEDDWYMDYPSTEEAYNRFIKQGVLSSAQIAEAIQNTNVFLDFEDVELDKSKKLPTLYPGLTQAERNDRYLRLVRQQWEVFSEGMTAADKSIREEGIQYETETIASTNMSDYFLLDYEIVKRAKEMGGVITTTGRGSGVSFYTNTLLGFSSVDRFSIPVEMFPDRFISADRIFAGNLPDLDLNVANEEVFAQAQAEVMGPWRSAPMVAFGTLRRLSAWKMYCRAHQVPFDVANTVSDQLKSYEFDMKHADEDEKEAIDVAAYVPEAYLTLVRESEAYMGMIDSISPHPCAHLLCCNDIRREIGVIRLNCKGKKKQTVYAAFIDGATAERFGYLKNDVLHVDVVGVNREVFSRVGIKQPTVNELLEMTRNDPDPWRMYAQGYTMGLNQVERPKTRDKVMQYRPTNITELSAFVAAVRPSFQSMLQTFLTRTPFSYGIPAFDSLIQTREMTSSFLIYQEQVMKTLQYGGLTAPESYSAIKAIAKKHPEQVLPLEKRFLDGFSHHLMEDQPGQYEQALDTAEKVWRIIEDATSYGFNASHAVCVAVDSLYGAYAKAHHPLEYYTTLLSLYGKKGDKDRIALVKIEMAKAFNIHVMPCRFRQDNRGYFIDHGNNAISDALTSVKHLSATVANALYEMRDNFYLSFTDLMYDMEMHPAFDSRNVEILIRMGYFNEFGSTGKLLDVYDAFHNSANRFSKTLIPASQQKRLAALREVEEALPERDIPMAEQLAFEVQHYGTPLAVYPDARGVYAVLEIDEKYSPKVKLYKVAGGNTGMMKILKKTYLQQPLSPGSLVKVQKWDKRPAVRYVAGERVKTGKDELWLRQYVVL